MYRKNKENYTNYECKKFIFKFDISAADALYKEESL